MNLGTKILPKMSNILLTKIITPVCIIFIIVGCGTTEAENLTFDLKIDDRKLNVEKIEVKQSDHLTLNIISDEAGTVHIHGYDYKENVPSEDLAKLLLEASITGKFNIAFHPLTEHKKDTESVGKHDSHQEDHDHKVNEVIIGSLEVYPR